MATDPATENVDHDDAGPPLVVPPEQWAGVLQRSGRPPTADDQSRTYDGRVLNSKTAVLEFLEELAAARAEGRSLIPEGR